MSAHHFIFSKGPWIGEGRITFSSSPDHLRFYTKWIVEPLENGSIFCRQQIEIEGGGEHTTNQITFSDISQETFQVKLIPGASESVLGKGVMDRRTIAWEFRSNTDFEGFEVYELQENGDYMLHAEYASTTQFRTIIDGRIWKKSV